MNWFSHHESVYLEYTNQFNHVTKYIWIDSIKSNKWIKLFNQINQSIQYICWPFLGNLLFRWAFFGKRPISLTFYWETFDFVDIFLDILNQFNWFNHTSPSKSIDSSHLIYENELTQSQINSLGKGIESIQSILRKEWIDSNQPTHSSWLVYMSERASLPIYGGSKFVNCRKQTNTKIGSVPYFSVIAITELSMPWFHQFAVASAQWLSFTHMIVLTCDDAILLSTVRFIDAFFKPIFIQADFYSDWTI